MKIPVADSRIIEALKEFPEGLKNCELKPKARVHDSNLSASLIRLQTSGVIIRNPETRRYLLTPTGENVANASEMDIITKDNRNRKLTMQLTSDADDGYWLGILPVEASIYLSPEIKDLMRDVKKGKYANEARQDDPEVDQTGDLYRAKEAVFRYTIRPATTLFERLLFQRLSEFFTHYSVDLMKKHRRLWSVPPDGKNLSQLLSTLREKDDGVDASKYSAAKLLDFDAAIVVRVWREELTRKSDNVKDRIAATILLDRWRDLVRCMELMTQRKRQGRLKPAEERDADSFTLLMNIVWLKFITRLGLISDEQFKRLSKSRSSKTLQAKIRELVREYYIRIYHEEPDLASLEKPQQVDLGLDFERALNQAR